MIEAPTDQNTRDALKRAHEERGQVLRDAWRWLFPSTDSR